MKIESHLLDGLFFISSVLNKEKISYAIIGGIAISYWSVPRYTKDLDLTLSLTHTNWVKLKKTLDANKVKWILIQQPLEESIPDLVRLTWKNQLIDFQISKTKHQESLIKRRKKVILEGRAIYIASPEDIFVLKLLANRPQDRADIHQLIQDVKKMNLPYIRKWCKFWEIQDRLEDYSLWS